MLIIRVSDTAAHVESGSPIPSGSVSNPTVAFQLDDFWKGYAVTAQFSGAGKQVDLANIKSNKEYSVPWECITDSGVLTLRVFGINADSVATTEPTTVQVVDSGIGSASFPQKPTPSAYQQYVEQVHSFAESADINAHIAQECAEISRQSVAAVTEIPRLLAQTNEAAAIANDAATAAEAAVRDANVACELAAKAAKMKPAALVEANKGREVRFWFGTTAEYTAQVEAGAISDTTYCIITDDTSVQEVVSALATVQDILAGQHDTLEAISDALLISIDSPFSPLNTHCWKVTPQSANHPAIDEETASNFIGIREPVLRLDDDIVAVIRMTEITPVFGRQWIARYSLSEDSWYNDGWSLLSTPQN